MRLIVTATMLALAAPLFAADPQMEEMLELIRQQQEQITILQKQLDTQRDNMDALRQKVEAATRTSEEANQKAEILAENIESQPVKMESANTIGGYGELHVNMLENQLTGEDKNVLDLHRFVLFYGHRFTDRLRMNSELEVEHAVSGGDYPGEVEIEQAYIEYDWADHHSLRAGLFLLPIGFLNETHEPPTFYGVERNPVESQIIPTTWWEGGLALTGSFADGWRYDFAAHSGLYTGSDSDYAVRPGRQKGAKARFDSTAYTGRLRWLGVPGLELSASVQYQQDITQETDPLAGGAWLYSALVGWQRDSFGLRALYASWDLDGAGPKAIGADRQDGWFVEPSWRFNDQWGVFARYNRWDNLANSAFDTEYTQIDLGVNFWLHPQVVFKLDYQDQDAPPGKPEMDGFNLGVGYQF